MFSNLFEERDKKITHLIKLGDCLGRSLRENTSLFSIDAQNSLVTYLTEGNKVIKGNYEIGKDIILKNIEIQDSSIFEDESIFDNFVNDKIHSFVESIHYGEYSSAEDSFEDILSLWENRLKLSNIQSKLHEKTEKIKKIEKIIECEEVQRLFEISPQLESFLEKNYEKISNVPEIKNAINLSNAISSAFNFPKLSYDQLIESKQYILKEGAEDSIYEMVCRQELVKRELIESKREFDTIWATNSSIRKLAGLIFEDIEEIVPVLSESLKEIPYLALSSKKTLFNTFKNCLAQTDGIGVSDKDIQRYASKIFEMKKEVKGMFIEMINEKYGVNIQNLQDPVSFRSLVNTQIVIFEALSRLAPKGGIVKEVLSEVGDSLKNKSGVESIDLNDYIYEIFTKAGYTNLLDENKTMSKYSKIDFKRVAKGLGDAQEVILSLKDKVDPNIDQEYSSDESLDNKKMAAETAKEDKSKETAEAPSAEERPPGGEAAPTPEEAEATPEVPETESQGEVVDDLTDLENMVADIAAELGVENKEEEEK